MHTNKSWFVALAFAMAGCNSEFETNDNNAPLLNESKEQVIGGEATHDLPAVVALYGKVPGAEKGTLCTASIVSPTVVLSAAHCVQPDPNGEKKYVIFTKDDIQDKSQRGPGFAVKEVHFDPRWSGDNLSAGYDIAVAILEKPIDIAPLPINRVPLTDDLKGSTVRLIGYGLNSRVSDTGAGVKRQAFVPLDGWNDQFVHTGQFLGKTICNGDSGGPILAKINGVETIVGVNSYGYIKCLGEASSTRPDTNLDFINQYLP